jgi:hypothetical protein
MDELFEKMSEYVKMTEEISTAEFVEYYQKVIERLQLDYDNMTEETLLKAKLITTILAGNSASRKGRKDQDAKKYKKMHEKSVFWSNAIEYRLKHMGLSAADIEEKVNALEAAM